MEGYITKEHTVWCWKCCEWVTLSEHKKSNFIKKIKNDGWKLLEKKWICPACAERINTNGS